MGRLDARSEGGSGGARRHRAGPPARRNTASGLVPGRNEDSSLVGPKRQPGALEALEPWALIQAGSSPGSFFWKLRANRRAFSSRERASPAARMESSSEPP